MNHVAAVAARVAHGEMDDGLGEIHSGAAVDDAGAAKEFTGDGQKNEHAENQAGERIKMAEAEREGDGAGDEPGKERPAEIALETVERSAAPGEKRAYSGEKKKKESDGNIHLVEKWRAHADLAAGNRFGDDREKSAPKNSEAGGEKNQVVEEKAGFSRDHGIELIVAAQIITILDERQSTDRDGQNQKTDEPVADGRLREGMDGTDDAAAREKRAQDAEEERGEDEPDVPHLHHAALFLHHHGVEKRGAGEPGEQRGVFDRVPAPVTAPAEHGVGPVRAENDSHGLKGPGDHGPAASDVNPFFAGIAADKRGEGEGERHAESGVAHIKIGRMDDHLGILEERVEAATIGEGSDLKQSAGAGSGERLERAGDEIVKRKKEKLDAGENHADVGHQLGMLAAIDEERGKRVAREQEAPEEQRAFLAGPKGGEFVKAGKVAAGMGHHVGHGEIIGEEKIDKAGGGEPDEDANGKARVARALEEEGMARENGRDAGADGVDGAQKGEKQSKTSEQIHNRSRLGLTGTARTCRARRTGLRLSRSRFVFGGAFGLDGFGDKAAVGHAMALDERLRAVFKSVGQRIAADVADFQLVSLLDDNKIDAAGEMLDRAGADIAGHAHALAGGGAAQTVELGDGVVIGFALGCAAKTEPAERAHNNHRADEKFRLLHDVPLPPPKSPNW